MDGSAHADAFAFTAFRSKIRSDIAQQNVQDTESFQKQIQFIHEVADVLRKNIVQGEKLNSPDARGDVYREQIFHSLLPLEGPA